MKKTANKKQVEKSRKSKFKRIFLPVIAILLSVTAVFAAGEAIFRSYVKGKVNVTTASIDLNAAFECSADSQNADLTFKKGGDKVEFNLKMTNSSLAHIAYTYKLKYVADNDIANAIFVYYDGEFLNTLGAFCKATNIEQALGQGYVKSQGGVDNSHTLTFELHEATPSSYYDGKNVTITVSSYTQSLEYSNYMLVVNEGEFAAAVDDINSGMLSEGTTIVLGDNISLAKDYELKSPCTIDVNGHVLNPNGHNLNLTGKGRYDIISSAIYADDTMSLSGQIVLNNAESVLNIDEMKAKNGAVAGRKYSAITNASAYNEQLASDLVISRLENTIKKSAQSGESIDLFSALGFYKGKMQVSAKEGTYNDGILTLPAVTESKANLLTIGGKNYEFDIIGSKTDAVLQELLQNDLKHLPTNGVDKITSDIFLPTHIKSKNARIVWTSSDENTMDSNGNLANAVSDNKLIKLYADITINGKNYKSEFSFRVSSQNNETKFSYLIAQLSPITLEYVYKKGENGAGGNENKAWFYLPVVNKDSKYDYRKEYTTPEDTTVSRTTWKGYKDINLKSIEYSVSNTYNYISVEKNADGNAYTYLNTAVFQTFAQINVKGTFNSGEQYETVLNVTIKMGDDADLLNKVFRHIEKELGEVNILENIITTRKKDGMLNERGDFYLPGDYEIYNITYKIPESSKGIISEIVEPGKTGTDGKVNNTKEYLVKVNASNFFSSDTAIAISVEVKPKKESENSTSTARGLYFNIPAIIKPDSSGFANLSVFNSIKYQIFTQLPEAERTYIETETNKKTEGYTYNTGFEVQGTTLTNKTGAYILMRDAQLPAIKQLILNVSEPKEDVNLKVFNFCKLIEWATGKTAGIKAEIIVAGTGATVSDGKDYLSPDELAVIKKYLNSSCGVGEANTEDNKIITAGFVKAPGKVISNGAALNTAIETLLSSWKSTNSVNNANTAYFKYIEILQWALNEKDFSSDDNEKAGAPPNGGVLIEEMYKIDKNGNEVLRKKDGTEYISEDEEYVLKAYWGKASTSSNKETYVDAFNKNTCVPTYLADNAISYFISEIYKAQGANPSSFVSTLGTCNGEIGVPVVSCLDGSLLGLKYLVNLEGLYIYGDCNNQNADKVTGLSSFLTTEGLSNFFNQTTANNKKIIKFTMLNSANNYVEFDLNFIERFVNLTDINLKGNSGIKNVGPLVNLKMEQLETVNIEGVDVSFEFSEYVMENIYSKSNPKSKAKIKYTDDEGKSKEYTTNKTVDESLTFLNEIGEITAEYLQLCKTIVPAKNIQWRIDLGNKMQLVSYAGGNLPTINSLSAMNKLLNNYYYCTESHDGLEKGHIYKIGLSGENITFADVETAELANSVDDILNYVPLENEKENITGFNSDEIISPPKIETSAKKRTVIYDAQDTDHQAQFRIDGQNYGMKKNQNNVSGKNEAHFGMAYIGIDNYTVTTSIHHKKTDASQGAKKYTASKRFYFTQQTGSYSIDGKTYALTKDTVITCTYQIIEGTLQITEWDEVTVEKKADIVYQGWRRAELGEIGWQRKNEEIKSSDNWKNASFKKQQWVSELISGYWDNVDKSYIDFKKATDINGNKINIDKTTSLPEEINRTSSTINEEKSVIITENPRFSPIPSIDSASKATIEQNAMDIKNSSPIKRYHYTGASGKEPLYVQGKDISARYEQNNSYAYTFGANGYELKPEGAYTQTPQGAVSMTSILEDANNNLNDNQFGYYYGNYYAYNGNTITTKDGLTFKNKHIYRLLTNSEGKFYFEHADSSKMRLSKKNTFEIISDTDNFLSIARNGSTDTEGNIYYFDVPNQKAGGGLMYYKNQSFYILDLNKDTGAYYLKRFEALDYVVNGSVVRFHNGRICPESERGTSFSGTGGTQDAIVTAVITNGDQKFERKFKISVIG